MEALTSSSDALKLILPRRRLNSLILVSAPTPSPVTPHQSLTVNFYRTSPLEITAQCPVTTLPLCQSPETGQELERKLKEEGEEQEALTYNIFLYVLTSKFLVLLCVLLLLLSSLRCLSSPSHGLLVPLWQPEGQERTRIRTKKAKIQEKRKSRDKLTFLEPLFIEAASCCCSLCFCVVIKERKNKNQKRKMLLERKKKR